MPSRHAGLPAADVAMRACRFTAIAATYHVAKRAIDTLLFIFTGMRKSGFRKDADALERAVIFSRQPPS